MSEQRDELLRRAMLLQKAKQIQQEKLKQQAPARSSPQESEKGIGDTILEYGGKALDVGLRTLDFPGGLGRVAYKGLQNIPRAAAKGLESIGIETELAKKPHLVTKEDFQKALEGRAPTMSEFAVREGADPGLATSAAGVAMDIALDPLTYATFGTSALKRAAEKTGRSIYKSGLKSLDVEAAKYGKEPVSDLLIKEGVTGSYKEIQKKIDDLANSYVKERDNILKKATRAGAEVDMKEAMQPLLAKIDEIKKSDDPSLVGLAQMMERDAQQYLARGAKEPEEVLRKLYRQAEYKPAYTEIKGFDESGQAIVGNTMPEQYIPKKPEIILDVTERVPGPTPIQVSQWKTSTYGAIGQPAWDVYKSDPTFKKLLKAKGFGLKKATESAVEKTLGPMSRQELVELNEKLGRLLTTDEKAAREAAKELGKNYVTSVDAPLAVASWRAAIAKKLADIAKTTKARTEVGKALVDRSKSNMILERNILASPWLEINRQRQD